MFRQPSIALVITPPVARIVVLTAVEFDRQADR
jgi:hypothetical protein